MKHLAQAIREDIKQCQQKMGPLSTWSGRSSSSTTCSSTSTTVGTDITFTRERGGKRSSRALCCCAFSCLLLVAFSATVGIYFGFVSEQLRAARVDEVRVFGGRVRLTAGDSYTAALTGSSGEAEYSKKARFYRAKLDDIFHDSVLKPAYIGSEILSLDGHPGEDLIVYFNVRMDGRVISVDAGDIYIVLAESLREGRFFQQFTVDHNSLRVHERSAISRPPMQPIEADMFSALHRASSSQSSQSQSSQLSWQSLMTSQSAPRCEPISVQFCVGRLSYNYTTYPNLLNMEHSAQVHQHIISFREVVDSECYRLAHDFVCQLLQPACVSTSHTGTSTSSTNNPSSTARLIPPCRHYCRQFVDKCGARLPASFSKQLNCQQLPALAESACLPQPGCIRDLELRGYSGRVCDGVPDCQDGSDEADCSECPAGHVRCPAESGCVPATALCDGQADCPLSGDETNCVGIEPVADDRVNDPANDSLSGFLTYTRSGQRRLVCADTNNNNSSKAEDTRSAEVTYKTEAAAANRHTDMSHVCRHFSYDSAHQSARKYSQTELGHVTGEVTRSPWPPILTQCPSRRAVFISCSKHVCGGQGSGGGPLRDDGARWLTDAQMPWTSLLVRDNIHHCHAVVVDRWWLLTSVHCFDGMARSRWMIVAGVSRRASQPRHAQQRLVTGMIRSPLGGSSVALVRLDRPLTYTAHVQPLCVDGGATWRHNVSLDQCFSVHWHSDSGKARYVRADKVVACRNTSSSSVSQSLCSTSYVGADYSGTELVGSPLVCRRKRRWRLVGVASTNAAFPLADGEADTMHVQSSYEAFEPNADWVTSSMTSFDGA